jgi:hypothetical protein
VGEQITSILKIGAVSIHKGQAGRDLPRSVPSHSLCDTYQSLLAMAR